MAASEASECRSHGLYRLIGYVGSLRSGRVSATLKIVDAKTFAAVGGKAA